MNKIRKYLLILWPFIFSVTVFVVFLFVRYDYLFGTDVKATIVSLMFTLLGFSITSLTIIAGFMKDSIKVLLAMGKGYFITVILLIFWMLIISTITLLSSIYNWPSFIYVATSLSGVVVVSYFIYVVIQIIRFVIRTEKSKQ